MKQEISDMLDSLKSLRDKAFQQQLQEVHIQLGRAMGNLIRVKELLK